jgi:hypothetical protein
VKLWSLTACLLLLFGCASDKSFISGQANLKDVAHVITNSQNRSGLSDAKVIYISEVDGRATTNILLTIPPTDIYLTPGHHTIEVTYRHNGMVAENDIPLTVMGGKEYLVHEKAIGYRINFWITLGENGEIVTGSKI